MFPPKVPSFTRLGLDNDYVNFDISLKRFQALTVENVSAPLTLAPQNLYVSLLLYIISRA